MMLNEEKISHLAHLVLRGILDGGLAALTDEEEKALKEVKRVITDEVMVEEHIDRAVRQKLHSYSREIVEGSTEWKILYTKFTEEEHRRRKKPP